jgi:hypothetical protein
VSPPRSRRPSEGGELLRRQAVHAPRHPTSASPAPGRFAAARLYHRTVIVSATLGGHHLFPLLWRLAVEPWMQLSLVRSRTLCAAMNPCCAAPPRDSPSIVSWSSLHACHTQFYKENRMHLMCAPGSKLHTHDRQTSVIP